MTRGTVAVMLLLAVLWAAAFPVIKIGLEGFSAPHLTLLRHLAASLAFLAFLLVLRRPLLPARRDWPALLGLGVIGIFVYHLALNTGEQRVSAGASSLIIATAPLLTALFATATGREHLSRVGWLGSLLGFVGVAPIVLGDAAAAGGAAGLVLEPYAALVMLSAVAAALLVVLQRPLLQRYRPLELMAYVTWAGTLPMLLFLPGLGAAVGGAGTLPLLAAVQLGVLPSAVAYTLLALALTRAPATLVTPYLYLIPVLALAFSWWWLAEVPTALTVVGGAVVVASLSLGHKARRRQAAPQALDLRSTGD